MPSSPDGRLDVEQDPKLTDFLDRRPNADRAADHVHGEQLRRKKPGARQGTGGNAGQPRGARTLVEVSSTDFARRASTSPASSWISNSCRKAASRISSALSTISATRSARHEPETDGRAARRGLELRLQISGSAGRRHHPDELRLALADLRRRARSRRRIGSNATSTTS